jgi:hypothetical protein
LHIVQTIGIKPIDFLPVTRLLKPQGLNTATDIVEALAAGWVPQQTDQWNAITVVGKKKVEAWLEQVQIWVR